MMLLVHRAKCIKLSAKGPRLELIRFIVALFVLSFAQLNCLYVNYFIAIRVVRNNKKMVYTHIMINLRHVISAKLCRPC